MRKSAACGRNVGNLFFHPDTNGAGVLFYLDLNPQQFPLLGVFRLAASVDGDRSKNAQPPSRGYRFASRRAHYALPRRVGYPRTRPEEKCRIAVESYCRSKSLWSSLRSCCGQLPHTLRKNSQSFADNCVWSLHGKFSHRCRVAESSPEALNCCRLQSYENQTVPSGHVQC